MNGLSEPKFAWHFTLAPDKTVIRVIQSVSIAPGKFWQTVLN